MIFNVTVDRDEDGVWVVECPAIPGCVSQGSTKHEALENVKDAIKLCLQVRGEQGLPLTIETKQVEATVTGIVDLLAVEKKRLSDRLDGERPPLNE
jgi:predicted RNase H-like HicB family nuclease